MLLCNAIGTKEDASSTRTQGSVSITSVSTRAAFDLKPCSRSNPAARRGLSGLPGARDDPASIALHALVTAGMKLSYRAELHYGTSQATQAARLASPRCAQVLREILSSLSPSLAFRALGPSGAAPVALRASVRPGVFAGWGPVQRRRTGRTSDLP